MILPQGLTQDLIQGLVWSLIGFIAGYLVANLKMEMDQIKEAVVNDDSDEDRVGGMGGPGGVGGVGGTGGGTGGVGGIGGQGGPGGEGEYRPRGSRLLGVVVIILALATVAQGVHFTRQGREQSEHDRKVSQCQAQFNKDFATVSALRGQWAAEDRAAVLKLEEESLSMWTAFLSPQATQASRLKAAREYTAASREFATTMHKNEDLRKQNPLPDLSDRDCT